MYQKINIIGRLGNDPELRYTQTGKAVCSMSVATSEYWKDANGQKQEKTTWFRVTAWGALAEVVNQHLTKGSLIMAEGTVSTSAYANNQGQPAASLELTAKEIKFLSGRNEAVPAGHASNGDDIPF